MRCMQIVFGATKINKTVESEALSQYYVPAFATMTFAMAEYFVSYSGFAGDEDPAFREDIFDALSLLQCSMIASPVYLLSPHETPGFNTLSADPTMYGVGINTKANQVREVKLDGMLAHQFGSGLIRYEPELGNLAYQLPMCGPDESFVPTRANTPDQ